MVSISILLSILQFILLFQKAKKLINVKQTSIYFKASINLFKKVYENKN